MRQAPVLDPLRLGIVLCFFSVCTLALVGRLWYLQIMDHQSFVQQAENNHRDEEKVNPPRGSITDKDGNPLALSIAGWEISLDSRVLLASEPYQKRTIPSLARNTGISEQTLLDKIREADGKALVLVSNFDYQKGNLLADALLPGVVMRETSRRSYPEGSVAAPLIGFIGRDGVGLTGLEADYQDNLAGTPGTFVFERDSIGNPIPVGYRAITSPKQGQNVVLTLDRYIQRIAERELNAAVTRHKADGGTVIIMNPHNGAILGMASNPTFDLTNLKLENAEAISNVRNRALTDLYEPGSTFKVLTMAAAINEGLVTPDTTYVDNGPVYKHGYNINTWDGAHWGTETMTQLLIHSNNVGAVWVSDKLGPDTFYRYVNQLGFGRPTGIGLTGEAVGQMRTPKTPTWSPIDLNTNAFGQGISATPLQVITAINAAVNGGTLYQPYIVQGLQGTRTTQTFGATSGTRIFSSDTSQKLRMMMKTVSELGSPLAQVKGFNVGIKTGTATIPTAGGYLADATIASIVGFFPYEDPKAVVLVKIDHPRDSPWGSQTAAPVFSAIARELLIYWRIPPASDSKAR